MSGVNKLERPTWEEVARAKEQERRRCGSPKRKALDATEHEHDARVFALQAERDEIDKRADAERQRWEPQRHKLRAALHRAKQYRADIGPERFASLRFGAHGPLPMDFVCVAAALPLALVLLELAYAPFLLGWL
jgi:hypothetical protein